MTLITRAIIGNCQVLADYGARHESGDIDGASGHDASREEPGYVGEIREIPLAGHGAPVDHAVPRSNSARPISRRPGVVYNYPRGHRHP